MLVYLPARTINDEGGVVEIAVPFSCLRFPDQEENDFPDRWEADPLLTYPLDPFSIFISDPPGITGFMTRATTGTPPGSGHGVSTS